MSDRASEAAASATDDVEVEWQFDAVDLRPVERWLADLPGRPIGGLTATQALTALAKPVVHQVDRYLDTEDWRIGRAGFVLRTRRKRRRDEATLKDSRPAGEDGLRRRLEVTEPLRPDGIAGLGTGGPVGRRLWAVAGSRPLHQILEIRTRRRAFSLRVAGEEVAELALDETTIVGDTAARPVRLRRVEVEVAHGWVVALEPMVADLREACGLQPAALSKYEAGLLALGITIPGLPDLGSTAVSPDASLGEVAYAVLRRHLGVVLARESGTRLGEDVEDLHVMRVATRRLRAAIDVFISVLPVRINGLRSELGWLAAVLGDVRDLDVQLEHLDNMGEWSIAWASSEVTEDPLIHLRQLLDEHRDEARGRLLDALDSARYQRLLKGLTALAVQGPSRRFAAAGVPAVISVPDLLASRHRSVLKGARRARKSGLAADFHRLRIRAKRLRYSLEFTADLYGSRTERFVRRLARLQDALGLMQDAEVATAQLLAITAASGSDLPSLTVFAMGSVAERYRVEAADLLASMTRRLKVLDGDEWKALAHLMADRRDEALAAIPIPRPRTRPNPSSAALPGAPTEPTEPTEPSTAPTEAVSAGEGQAAGEPDIKPTPFDMVTEIEHCDEVPALTAVTSPGASVGLVALPDEVDPMPAEGPADHLTNAVGER
jgi:CHAD domain-containing protein